MSMSSTFFASRVASSLEQRASSSYIRRPTYSNRVCHRSVAVASAQNEGGSNVTSSSSSPAPPASAPSYLEIRAPNTDAKIPSTTWTKRIDMTVPEWWRQVDDWEAFFRSEEYLLDDGDIEAYMLPEDIEEDRIRLRQVSNQILPAYLKEKGRNPAVMPREDPLLLEREAQEAADKDLEADFDAEDVVDEEDAPKAEKGGTTPDESRYRHAVLQALADLEARTDIDPNFTSLMAPDLRKRLLYLNQTDSELHNAWPIDPEMSEWDLRAKIEKRRRLQAEKADFDRRRALIGQFPARAVGPSDVRLKNGPNYEEMFGKKWTEEEIWNLITMDGEAADIRKIGDRVLTTLDPEALFDYPGTFGYEYVLETEEFLVKTGHWMRPGSISTDAELTLLSSDFKDLDALNALSGMSRGPGAPKKSATGLADGMALESEQGGESNDDDF